MTEDPQNPKRSMLEWLRDVPSQVLIGLLVAAVTGVIVWAFIYVRDRITSEPLTAHITTGDGQASIRPFFDLQIRPALGAYCSEPAWVQWVGDLIWDKQCRRIRFDPHGLADMETRRVPFRESAEPIELMEIFIDRHAGCLRAELKGDTYRIFEPADSEVVRERSVAICP